MIQEQQFDYFVRLGNLFLETKVTDEKGNFIDLPVGLGTIIDHIVSHVKKDNKVILIGNGGSASIASHIAVDLWKNGGVRAISFNDGSLLTCVSNDYSYGQVFEKPVECFADKGDMLIAISSSGRSENILSGVKAARLKRCNVITMSGFAPENPLRTMGDTNFYVPSDSYGFVEIAHLTLCHCIVDTIVNKKI